ncbi:MAG: PAS domain-containing protein, partial [Candidatus Thorarchaeota archaeon]
MKETQSDPEQTDSSHSYDTQVFSKELIEALFMESRAGILICDPQGNIQKINRTGIEALGSPSEEATKQINLLTFPPLRDMGFSEILRTCISEKIAITKEMPYVSKWEKSVILQFRIIPLCDVKGTLILILCIFEDTKRL